MTPIVTRVSVRNTLNLLNLEKQDNIFLIKSWINLDTTMNDINNFYSMISKNPQSSTFSLDQLYETQLLKQFNNSYCPLFIYREILKWAKSSSQWGYRFNPMKIHKESHNNYLNFFFSCSCFIGLRTKMNYTGICI